MPNPSDLLSHHISQQFNHELEELRNHLLSMGGMVEKQVSDAIKALINADSNLAILVCEKDTDINFMETSIDQECSRMLARRQPVIYGWFWPVPRWLRIWSVLGMKRQRSPGLP